MAYDDKIQETQVAAYAELYQFRIGDVFYFYTSFSKNVIYDGNLYHARSLKRHDFKKDKDLAPRQLRIDMPLTEFALAYVAEAPVETIQVSIVRIMQDGSDEGTVVFSGEVIDITLSGNGASAVCESGSDILRNRIPQLIYQPRCHNFVFDDGCTLDENSYKITSAVTVDGSDLVSAAFDAFDNGYFTGGYVRAVTDVRMITNHIDDRITLQIPFPASAVITGTVVDTFPGCDRSRDTCVNKYSNYDNFVGFIYIPSTNPVIYSL